MAYFSTALGEKVILSADLGLQALDLKYSIAHRKTAVSDSQTPLLPFGLLFGRDIRSDSLAALSRGV